MGNLLLEQGRLAEAEPYLGEAWEKSRSVLGEFDPDTLFAISQRGALLVAQRKYAEAEKLLAPVEAATRDMASLHVLYPRALLLPRALIRMSLGKARAGLGKFAAAEPDLLAAQAELGTEDTLPDPHRQRDTQAVIDLYTAWNIAEPNKGYAAKAAEWKRRQEALTAAGSSRRSAP